MAKTEQQRAALARLAVLQGGTPEAFRTATSLVERLVRLTTSPAFIKSKKKRRK